MPVLCLSQDEIQLFANVRQVFGELGFPSDAVEDGVDDEVRHDEGQAELKDFLRGLARRQLLESEGAQGGGQLDDLGGHGLERGTTTSRSCRLRHSSTDYKGSRFMDCSLFTEERKISEDITRRVRID